MIRETGLEPLAGLLFAQGGAGAPALADIVKELLKPGMELRRTLRNVVDFGVHRDGLGSGGGRGEKAHQPDDETAGRYAAGRETGTDLRRSVPAVFPGLRIYGIY